jgi:hypothetical protein
MAAKGVEKRRRIFERFSSHLSFLKANNLLRGISLKYDKTYICPICLRQFSEQDLADTAPNMLTVEHAPPDASGGKGMVLTCKECNSVAGSEIDFHLIERIQEAERRQLLPNTSAKVRVTSGNLTVQASVQVGADGVMTMRHSNKNNHPQKLLSFVDRVGPTTNPFIQIEFGKIQTDAHRMQVGLLKTAYILAFAEFGYSFLLDSVYDTVRKQLLNPGAVIYPEGFWHKDHEAFAKHEGVHFCTTPIVEGIHCVFPIRTATTTHRFGVHLPIPMTSPEVMIEGLHRMGPNSAIADHFNLEPVDPDDDYLFDINRIDSRYAWFLKTRWSKIDLTAFRTIPMALSLLRKPLPEWYPLKPIYAANAGNFRAFAPFKQ